MTTDPSAKRIRDQLTDEPRLQSRLMHTIGIVIDTLGRPEEAAPLHQEALTIRRRAGVVVVVAVLDPLEDVAGSIVPAERIRIETPGELSTILHWLASADLDDVYVQPVGLRSVYDRFHHDEADPVRQVVQPA